jgi:xanthine dehydrogenase accessory factor
MSEFIYRQIYALLEKGKTGAICTIIESSGSAPRHEGTKMLVYPDGSFIGTVGGGEIENRVRLEAQNVIKEQHGKVLKYSMVDPQKGDPGTCGGTVEVYIEPVLPKAKVIIIGGGHVGKAVASLAKWLGFQVAVSDDREEFCTPEANPDAEEFFPIPMHELPSKSNITASTYLILTTRGSNVDVAGLAPLLESEAAYIGVIGSKRRWTITKNALKDQGISQEKLSRVYSPMGLELNAETPEEIAVSIMAEIIMIRNGGTGETMKI